MTSRAPAPVHLTPVDRIERALANLARELRECGIGDVGGVRGTSVMDGSQWSGVNVVPSPPAPAPGLTPNREGTSANILNCKRVGSSPLGGMASIHVHVTDDSTAAREGPPNCRLVMDITWQSGRGGGEAQVDITRGGVFTVGAADTITAKARIVPATDGSFTPGQDQRVEATVCWGGSISPKAALGTSEGQTLIALGTTSAIPIPRQAAGVMVVSTDPANYAGMLIEMFRDTGTRCYAAFNPFGNMVPIVSGAQNIAITVVGACIVIPVWELHL
jgi:hypothetical protein